MVRLNGSGVLALDKPVGPTSHDVVASVRRLLSIRRAGHAGTLDPMASGVLVVLLGQATKLAPFLSAHDKSYEARIVLGRATTTLDAQGEPTRDAPIPAWLGDELKRLSGSAGTAGRMHLAPRLAAALVSEHARTLQNPPAYSAIKVGGRRSYDRARAGEDVLLQDRCVSVAHIELMRAAWMPSESLASLEIRLTVSKGYYVRSLARDIGATLGVPAHLGALRRTASGPFDIASAVPLDGGKEALCAAIMPLGTAVAKCLPTGRLSPSGAVRARHGKHLDAADFTHPPPLVDSPAAWIDPDGRLVAIGTCRRVSAADELVVMRGFSGDPAECSDGDHD